MLLRLLQARGVRVGKKPGRRLRAERDEATLDRWVVAALSCVSGDDLLGE